MEAFGGVGRKAQIGRLCSAEGVWDLVPPRKRGSCEPDVYVGGGGAGKSAWQCPFSLGIALLSGYSLRRGPCLHCARLGMGTNSCENQIRKAPQSGSHVSTIHPTLDRLPICWHGGGYPWPPPNVSSLFCNQIAFYLQDVCTCMCVYVLRWRLPPPPPPTAGSPPTLISTPDCHPSSSCPVRRFRDVSHSLRWLQWSQGRVVLGKWFSKVVRSC